VKVKGNGTKTLTGEGKITYSGCIDTVFGGTCQVGSIGEANGTIVASGKGAGSMVLTKTFANLASSAGSPFTNITYRHKTVKNECPLVGINGEVTGSVTVEIASPDTDLHEHTGTVTAQSLAFGGEPAELENAAGSNKPTVKLVGVGESTTLAVGLK
jgi:hypothetical protein